MDSIYWASLLISLLAGALAVLLGFLSLRPSMAARLPRLLQSATKRRRIAALAIVVAVASLLVSVGVHITWGHRPGTPEGLAVFEFLEVHTSYLFAAGLPAFAAVLLWLGGNHATRMNRRDAA